MHHAPWQRIGQAAAVALITLLVLPGIARAHEGRDVSGYQFTVGFTTEPAIEGEQNGVDFRIAKDDQPVAGAEATLQVEITHVDTAITKTFALGGVFNAPGRYTTDFIPTADGQYRFRFFGTLDGTPIDETFTSGPNTFGDVESPAELEFPIALPTSRELVAGVRGATDTAAAADDSASSARALAIAGIVLGLLGIVTGVGGAVWARRRV